MTDDEAEKKAREELPLAVQVLENWFASGNSLEWVQDKIRELSTDKWKPIMLQAARNIQMRLAQEALKEAGDK